MRIIDINIDDDVYEKLENLASQDNQSVNAFASRKLEEFALAAQVSASQARESISSRAKRVDWQKVDNILDRVPANPPIPGDETE